MKKYIPLLSAVATSVLFGFSYFAVKLVLAVVGDDTFRLLCIRFIVAALFMTLLWAVGVLKLNFKGKDCRILFPCALCSPICYFIFETFALRITPSSQVGLMTSMSPVITMVLAAVIFKDFPTKKQIFYVGMTLLGLLIINYTGDSSTGGALSFLLMFLTIFSGCCSSIAVKYASAQFSPVEIVYSNTCMAAVVFTVIAVVQGVVGGTMGTFFDGMLTPTFILGILYLSVGCSIIAFGLNFYNVSKLPLSVVSSFSAITTVVTILVGVLLLGEPFRLVDGIGTVLILGGVWLMNNSGHEAQTRQEQQ